MNRMVTIISTPFHTEMDYAKKRQKNLPSIPPQPNAELCTLNVCRDKSRC